VAEGSMEFSCRCLMVVVSKAAEIA